MWGGVSRNLVFGGQNPPKKQVFGGQPFSFWGVSRMCAPLGGRRPATAPTRAPNLVCRPRLQPACIQHVRAARCCVVCMGARVPWCVWVHGCRAAHRTVATPTHPRTRIGCMHAQRVSLGVPCIVLAVSHACMPAAAGAPTTRMRARPSPRRLRQGRTLHTRRQHDVQPAPRHGPAIAALAHAACMTCGLGTCLAVDDCPARPYPVLASTDIQLHQSPPPPVDADAGAQSCTCLVLASAPRTPTMHGLVVAESPGQRAHACCHPCAALARTRSPCAVRRHLRHLGHFKP